MSFGSGPSRKDLLDTIESQKKQLVQYQTRFKDVVQAYKSLLKEKEALEASLKVLTLTQEVELNQNNQDTPTTSDLHDDGSSLHSEDSIDTAASVDMPCETTKGDPSEDDQTEPGGKSSSAVRFKSLLRCYLTSVQTHSIHTTSNHCKNYCDRHNQPDRHN